MADFDPRGTKVPVDENEKKKLSVIFDPKHTPIQLCSLKFKFFDKTGHPNNHPRPRVGGKYSNEVHPPPEHQEKKV